MAKGSQGFASTYFISGVGTPLWEHVQESHTKKDAMHYSSGPSAKLPFTVAMAELVLGYDAVLMFATAMDSLIQKDLTISGPALAEALRNVSIIASPWGKMLLAHFLTFFASDLSSPYLLM